MFRETPASAFSLLIGRICVCQKNGCPSGSLNAFRGITGFDVVAKLAIEYGIERAATIEYTGSNVRVTAENMPYLHECVSRACEILSVGKLPDVYIQESPFINAFTMGSENPILVINNSILHRLSHEELMFLIGHEIGHIKSEHVQYSLYGQVLQGVINQAVSGIPYVGEIMPSALYLAYMEWSRNAEFTADHAGLLVCQDLPSAISCLAKLGGYPLEFYQCLDPNDFLQQALDFKDLDDSVYNKALKFLANLEQSHPWCVLRAKELYEWVESGHYARILLRSSDWLADEIKRLSEATDKAVGKKDKKRQRAAEALSQLKDAKRTLSEHREATEGAEGHRRVLAAAQEGMMAVQARLSEGDAKRKSDALSASDDAFKNAAAAEKALRQTYRPATQEDVDAVTAGAIGELSCERPRREREGSASSEEEDLQKGGAFAQAGNAVAKLTARAGAAVEEALASVKGPQG